MKETRDVGDAADLEDIHFSERSDAHLKGSVEKGDSLYLGVNLLRYQNSSLNSSTLGRAIEMCSGLRGQDEVIESEGKQCAMNISSWTCCVQTLETSEADVYPQAVQVDSAVASSVADIMEI